MAIADRNPKTIMVSQIIKKNIIMVDLHFEAGIRRD